MIYLLVLMALIVLGMMAYNLVELLSDPCERCGRPMLHLKQDSIRCDYCNSPEGA